MTNKLLFLIISTLIWTKCSHSHNNEEGGGHVHEEENGHAHEGETASGNNEEHDDDEIKLSQIQMENIGIEYGQIESRKIQSILNLTGRIEIPASGQSVVGSSLEGKVKKVHVLAGDYVKKGQLIFTIENMEIIDWQLQLSNSRSELSYLLKELNRQKHLSDQSISPLKKYELALLEKEKMEANISALQSKLASIGIHSNGNNNFKSTFGVVAPSSGVIQHLLANIGEYIDATTHLASIINNDHLHIHLLAYGADVSLLDKGQKVKFFVQSRPEEILDAEVKWINSIVDESSNSYDVHAEILGKPKGLIAGEFVEARIINQERMIPSLPVSALTNDKGLNYIFVKEELHEDGTHFAKLKVEIGETDLGFVEIKAIDQIPENAEVVIEGAFFLMAESKKGEGGGGHHH